MNPGGCPRQDGPRDGGEQVLPAVTPPADGHGDLPLAVPQLDSDVDTLTAALAYARAGWYVLPVKALTKHAGSVLGKE